MGIRTFFQSGNAPRGSALPAGSAVGDPQVISFGRLVAAVYHGGNANATRPSGYAYVVWLGWVKPNNWKYKSDFWLLLPDQTGT